MQEFLKLMKRVKENNNNKKTVKYISYYDILQGDIEPTSILVQCEGCSQNTKRRNKCIIQMKIPVAIEIINLMQNKIDEEDIEDEEEKKKRNKTITLCINGLQQKIQFTKTLKKVKEKLKIRKLSKYTQIRYRNRMGNSESERRKSHYI
ncbi:hypothetical protein Glove_139g391 [Diversispora epigaea]|uniref:Uncharacterized protein n=1 Tax=Diversispora epigaea TaxID=1348612 RepID=A0A397IY51_9GLOM|nr:hypothetical protein Glove_139g391 [Diversispora epigaea]